MLTLTLGPLNLRITAIPSGMPGGGLLGDLLCGLINALNPTALAGLTPAQVAAILALVPTTG